MEVSRPRGRIGAVGAAYGIFWPRGRIRAVAATYAAATATPDPSRKSVTYTTAHGNLTGSLTH